MLGIEHPEEENRIPRVILAKAGYVELKQFHVVQVKLVYCHEIGPTCPSQLVVFFQIKSK